MARMEEGLGVKRPLTGWEDGGMCKLPDFAWNDWGRAQVRRCAAAMSAAGGAALPALCVCAVTDGVHLCNCELRCCAAAQPGAVGACAIRRCCMLARAQRQA
jgi:hypothetical protein